MESIWKKDCKFEKRETLRQDMKTDVAVIGAGMSGLLTAYLLQQKGLDVVVLEGNEIASGQTERTTAKITIQHDLIYNDFIDKFGKEKAYLYAKANQEALYKYNNIIQEKNIECHYESRPSYIYTLKDVSKIEKEVDAAKSLGIDAEFTVNTTLPFSVKGAVKFNGQAMFHPLEFLQEMVKTLNIFEHTMVRAIEDHTILTDYGKVQAKFIVVATHYPFINTPGYYFLRMHQERSYALALSNVPLMDGMYKDESDQGFSFRNHKDMLILGGGGHRTGENTAGGRYDKLKKAADEYFPGSTEVCRWSAQDCMTLDDIPYIGLYSASTPNVYVATGFKKWGMTSSMVSAILISDMITGEKNPYEEVFSPQRFKINASMGNFLNEGKHAASGLFQEYFKVPDTQLEQIAVGHGGVIDYEGHKLGVYKDPSGKIYMVSTKCKHLGCKLEWNPDELTWECPCHGSRYSYKGNLMDNPALEGLEHDGEM